MLIADNLNEIKNLSINSNYRGLIKSANTAVLIVDVQERLTPKVQKNNELVNQITMLIKCMKILGVKLYHTEQNPKRLGKTIEEISAELDTPAYNKMAFSCCKCEDLLSELKMNEINNIIICGLESHICILQTSLELIEEGFNVILARDAINSRKNIDHETAILRLSKSRVIISTVESIIFEVCEKADRNEFKSISKIIKEG